MLRGLGPQRDHRVKSSVQRLGTMHGQDSLLPASHTSGDVWEARRRWHGDEQLSIGCALNGARRWDPQSMMQHGLFCAGCANGADCLVTNASATSESILLTGTAGADEVGAHGIQVGRGRFSLVATSTNKKRGKKLSAHKSCQTIQLPGDRMVGVRGDSAWWVRGVSGRPWSGGLPLGRFGGGTEPLSGSGEGGADPAGGQEALAECEVAANQTHPA